MIERRGATRSTEVFSMDGPVYASVALVSAAVIALQICVMRIFAVGSWTHFGSMVISLAMLGFGLSSVVIFSLKPWFDRHWAISAGLSLAAFGPLTVVSNQCAQALPFNAIFLVSDPAQKWRLLANFVLYLLPFLSAALFLGIIFLKSSTAFSRAYFADLVGAGLGASVVLAGLYVLPPERIILIPLILWGGGMLAWFRGHGSMRALVLSPGLIALSMAVYIAAPSVFGIPTLQISSYKGISYARNFPDAERIYRDVSPFGDLQIYKSSYMHFAPGLSDNAAFNLPELPANIYAGMFIDGDGPEGIMRALPSADADYFHYLPAYYPYVIKTRPNTFIAQFGGDISTRVALQSGARSVTAAESNPAIVKAFRNPSLNAVSGSVLATPRLQLIDGDGRLFLEHSHKRYDVIDLGLADSVGLSNPGGFAVVEKYLYTRQAMAAYMRALAPGGILAVTVWNKEVPLKSVLKLYATVAEAAKAFDPGSARDALFVASSYLSTTTVLYKQGGFRADEIAKLRDYTQAMSFDEIYSPGFVYDTSKTKALLADYQASIFGSGADATSSGNLPSQDQTTTDPSADPVGSDADAPPADSGQDDTMPSTTMGRLAWHYLMQGGWPEIADAYVFDIRSLTDERPYFAGYERLSDLPAALSRLDLLQDDWGYLALWATLFVALASGLLLIILPLILGWRRIFSRAPGKISVVVYFACLGLGYIMVEVGLIGRFTLTLGSPAVSAAILITSMLISSGFGSLVSGWLIQPARKFMPVLLGAIGALLVVYGLALAPALNWIGGFAYPVRLVMALLLVAPPAFLMGFPMAAAMGWLARSGRDHLYVWAWGINGCFSVIGAAMVPIIATMYGLDTVLEVSAAAYCLAIPAFSGIFRGDGGGRLAI